MINTDDFKIRLDLIVRDDDIRSSVNWRTNPAILKMVDKVSHKDVLELFKEVIINEPFVEMKEYRNWLTLARSENIEERDIYRKNIRDFLNSNRGFGAGDDPNQFYYIYPYRYFGVNLNQPIEVHPDHEDFPLLFSFRLSKTKHPVKFLEFHFVNTFNQDRKTFRLLLTQLDKSIISERIELVNEWSEQNLKTKEIKKPFKMVKDTPLSEFFVFNYALEENADLFRTQIIDKLLKDKNAQLLPGAKKVLLQVVSFLQGNNVWRNDLSLGEIANRLKKEVPFPKLNEQYFQRDRRPAAITKKIQTHLTNIKWILNKKSV